MHLLIRSILPSLLLCSAGAYAGPAQDGSHAGHAPHASPAPAAPATGHVRYLPDAPLMAGMRRMASFVDALEHGRHGHLVPAQVRTIARGVREAADGMFAHCTLAPVPDAALHGLLARLLAGAQALEADPGDLSPVEPMRGVLLDYVRLFDDPAFPGDGAQ